MQGERDALHRFVMPKLRDIAAQYAESVQFVDLRWGISTVDMDSDEGASKILSVCLDEIRQCKPYMIILLGQRYGWIPSPELLTDAAASASYLLSDNDISVTELEIRYGMYLAQDKLERCIFCLRDDIPEEHLTEEQRQTYLADSDLCSQRMTALRNRIQNTPGARVIHYALTYDANSGELTGYDDFAERLSDELETILTPDWNARKNISWQEMQREEDLLLFNGHLSTFVGRTHELETIGNSIDQHQVVVLEGEGGCGKSALMAKLTQQCRQKGHLAEMFCCGNSTTCMTATQLLQLLCWQLDRFEGMLPIEQDHSEADWKSIYQTRAASYDGPDAVIFIDAIDQFSPDQALYESWFVPPVLSKKLRLVISTTGAVRVNPMALPSGNGEISSQAIKLTAPDESDLRQILQARFLAEHKQISNALADKILENPCSKNMLGMDVIVRRLIMMGQKDFAQIAILEKTMDGAAAIDTYLQNIAASLSHSLDQLIISFFDDVCTFLDQKNFSAMHLPLYVIAIMQHGMSLDQFQRLSERIKTDKAYSSIDKDHPWKNFWDPILFSKFKRYLGGLLIQRQDGRIDFSHRLLRQSLLTRSGVNNVAGIVRYWLYFEPKDDISRLENMAVLTRMDEDNNVYYDKDYVMDYDTLHTFFHSFINDSGNLEDSDDPLEAAEGKRQLDIISRSILSDLSGTNGKKHLSTYCRILENAIEKQAGINNYTVWFMGRRICPLLERQGDREKAISIYLYSCIIDSLWEQKRAWEAGAAQFESNWRPSHMRTFLFYHCRTLKLFSDLRLAFQMGHVELAYYYGLTPQVLYDKGLSLGDECIALDPTHPDSWFRKAALCVNLAKYSVSSFLGIGKSKPAKLVLQAMEFAAKGIEVARTHNNRLRFSSEYLLYIAAFSADVLYGLYHHQVFGAGSNLRLALQICENAWKEVLADGNVDDIQIETVAHFKYVWSKCLRVSGIENKKEREELQLRALNISAEYYYKIREEGHELGPGDREYLSYLSIEIAENLMRGLVPQVMVADGFTRRSAAGYLLEKEGSYLQAQARTDFESRQRWSIFACLEALYFSRVEPKRSIDACLRAMDILERLHAEAKKYSHLTEVPDIWINTDMNFMKRLLEINRGLLEEQNAGE